METNHPSPSDATIEAGRQALARGAWEEARSVFERALHTRDTDAAKHSFRAVLDEPEESADLLTGLAEALWWLGEIPESLECWERAYLGFRKRPDPAQAAIVAIQLGIIYEANLGNYAAAAGWVARAARLVDEHALEPLQGWVLIARAVDADPGKHEAVARQAHQLGRTFGDRDLELCALTEIGVALIDQGRIEDGIAFHDEAMAGALAGEGRLDTVVFTACEMMDSYSRCAQYQRMAQWIRAADRFVERYGCPYLNASCRTHYGEVLFATGDWARAEEELHAALRLSESSLPAVQARALASLAELRLAQGRVEEAERLMAGFEGHDASAPVCARIHLLRGKFALAAGTAQRWLDVFGEERLESTLLLEVIGEAEIAQARIDAATERGRKLTEMGGTLDCQIMLARGERLQGRALAAASDSAANRHLDAALRAFVRLEMPFEAARTRLLLARALRELDPEAAEAEARAALAVFESFGAVTDVEAATTVLRETETNPRNRRDEATGLTRREVEVLRLVAQGLSDKEIAIKLVISRHTVHRHIHSILTKLDLPSRTAAAAYAARHSLL